MCFYLYFRKLSWKELRLFISCSNILYTQSFKALYIKKDDNEEEEEEELSHTYFAVKISFRLTKGLKLCWHFTFPGLNFLFVFSLSLW